MYAPTLRTLVIVIIYVANPHIALYCVVGYRRGSGGKVSGVAENGKDAEEESDIVP